MRPHIAECIDIYNVRRAPGESLMTQAALAEHLGVSQAAVSRWNAGGRPLTVNMAHSIADFLGCDLTDLLPTPSIYQAGMRGNGTEDA